MVLERKENVVLLGPPGDGKSHLAISLAIVAAQRGRRVYHDTLIDLIASLEEAQAGGQLMRRLAVLTSNKGFEEWGSVFRDEAGSGSY